MTEEMSTHEIVKTLRRAKVVKGMLDEHTPENMKLELGSHSTAVHCSIYLTMGGSPDLLVWYKTNWVSPSYEFNERGKISGLQKGCEFVEPQLTQLFADVAQAVAEFDQRKSDEAAAADSRTKKNEEDLVDLYRESYPGRGRPASQGVRKR